MSSGQNQVAHEDANHAARVSGPQYYAFLAQLHRVLNPSTYFEIGTQTGRTLQLAQCRSIAVDPVFQLATDTMGQKPACFLYQLTSDAFFAAHDPSAIFGAPIDLAFLDGMHRAEFLLRDFINTEKHCAPASVIALHDCLPPGFYMTARDQRDPMTARSRFGGWWTGDVWKLLPILKRYRKDLSIHLLDCAPTGLVLVTNLNPASTVLGDAYDDIEAGFGPDLDRAAYDAFWAGDLDIASSLALGDAQRLKALLGR